MGKYILGRVGQAVLALWAVVTIVFVLGRLSGNPLELLLGPTASQADRAALAQYLGLDKPLLAQYGLYLVHAVQGNLGQSIFWQRPVVVTVMERVPATLELGFLAIVFTIVIGIPVGVLSAVRRGSILDTVARLVSVTGQSMPGFWLGILLIFIFAVKLKVLPAGGMGDWKSYILPAFTMGFASAAGIMRITRSCMLEVLDQDFVTLHRAKGLAESVVIWKHAMRNSSIPLVTFAVTLFVAFLGAAVVTETVFAWPGVGRLTLEAISYRDYPVVQGAILYLSALYVFANLAVDIAYVWIDPRVRY